MARKWLLILMASTLSALCHAKPPNIVLIYVDDLGWGDLSSYGHSIVETPRIDQLASEGLKLTQYYAPAPLCSPSRAGLLTGRTPYRTGIRSWIPENQDVHLGREEITIAHLLRSGGYQTAVMGKLHLNGGPDRHDHPQAADFGFDHSFIIHGGWVKNATVESVNDDGSLRRGAMFPDNFYRNGEAVGQTGKFSAELVSDEALNWLESIDSSKPFFLYLPYSEVHTPVASPQKWLDHYAEFISPSAKAEADVFHFDWKNLPYRGEGEYYANISFLDEQIGRVLDALEHRGESDNTMIIFTSDNGPVTRQTRRRWEIGMAGETGGFRGRKGNLFEGGIRVPAIVRYPAMIEANSSSDEPVSGLDWLPTLASIVGLEAPQDREIDGESVLRLLKGGDFARRKPMIFTIDTPDPDFPFNEWAIRQGDWKLILDRSEQPRYLFNMSQDRYELYNRINDEPSVLTMMMGVFSDLQQSIENDSIN